MSSSRLVNLTPHLITLCTEDGSGILETFPSEGSVRAHSHHQTKNEIASMHLNVPVFSPQIFSSVEGLPDDTSLNIIVSLVVGEFMRRTNHAWDGMVLGPDTGPDSCLRNAGGEIIGIRRFIQYK